MITQFGTDDPGKVVSILEKEVTPGLTVQELILPVAAVVLIVIVKKMKEKRKSKQIKRMYFMIF